MEHTSNNGFWKWGIFIVVIALIIWGLVAAEQKQSRESANVVLPDQIVETDHIKGSMMASTTLVEYGDFQCPACAAYMPVVEQVLADLGPDRVRFVYRHYPLPNHGNAIPASLASEAAHTQGKFWEMYALLYERQNSWKDATDAKAIFRTYAEELGLDLAKYDADYKLESTKDRINLDYKGGAKAGINATPTFFINGKKINNPANADELKKLLNDAASAPAF